ncbi:MAG: alanine--tRNA ligase [Thermodesulfovibrionales bacterium]
MKSSEIRNAFLDFFRSKQHELVKSSSLIPTSDPTLLFTTAGMVQFKSLFLGEESRAYSRATTCQKCVRAGGKSSDIENVGHTARHHTFFEMLGNFSFGDYFKRDAILFAWELLTEHYRLPKEKLWVTVFENDDEAEDLWVELAGVPRERIVRMGAKDNFWQMGDTGPCGPCSEILIDQGEEVGCGRPDCKVGCDCDRFLELWNLVFMQFNRDSEGNLTPLPRPSIDTGMGLERVSSVLQGKYNNFDTDIFAPLLSSIAEHTGVGYLKSPGTDVSMRVIADHIRSVTLLLADGVMPSNEWRGYVLRRIIRRAARHARLLGVTRPVLYRLVDSVASAMGDIYPETVTERSRAAKVLKFEEERFAKTLEQGMRIMDDLVGAVKKSGRNEIPGSEIFRLYDTYGFPVDLARDIASDHRLSLDEEGFQKEMDAQKKRARASWAGEEEAVPSLYRDVASLIGATDFVGYDAHEAESVVTALLSAGKRVQTVREGEEGEVVLDRTPFYGESGGQVGDSGELDGEGLSALVTDTKKPLEGVRVHHVKVVKGTLSVGDRVRCRIDRERRKSTMRNHTATHLLQAALRAVVGDHIKQAGSSVSPERLRFDFTHFSALSDAELSSVGRILNENVLENLPVTTAVMDTQSALDSGATALFGEKYGDAVRVVVIPDVSAELCGGTHCRSTGEIGSFVITSEGSVASGIRRIEALTGNEAFRYREEKGSELKRIQTLLKTDAAYARVEKMAAEMKALEKELEAFKARAAVQDSASLLEKTRSIDGVPVLACQLDGLDIKDLRGLADTLRERLGSGIICLASAKNSHASILTMVTADLTGRFNAGELMKDIASLSGGSGGGKAEMAQGGTGDLEKLETTLQSIDTLIRQKIST